MWDGALDGPAEKSAKDLTNTKLAKNQLVSHLHQVLKKSLMVVIGTASTD